MRIQSQLDAWRQQRQLLGRSNDGRWLTYELSGPKMLRVTWELNRVPATNRENPTDGIACQVWIPDRTGQVWSTIVRTTSEILLRELETAICEQEVWRWDKQPVYGSTPVDQMTSLLSDVCYFSDDRSGHFFSFGDETASVLFKYSELVFDVFLADHDDWSTTLLGRLQQGVEYDPNQPLSEVHYSYYLPALAFRMSEFLPKLIFGNGLAKDQYDGWNPTMFPQPLVFQLTEEAASPQECVVVTDSMSLD